MTGRRDSADTDGPVDGRTGHSKRRGCANPLWRRYGLLLGMRIEF